MDGGMCCRTEPWSLPISRLQLCRALMAPTPRCKQRGVGFIFSTLSGAYALEEFTETPLQAGA